MKFVPRRPVTNAIQYAQFAGTGLAEVRNFIEGMAFKQVESITETVRFPSPRLQIKLVGEVEEVHVKLGYWLCIDERRELNVLSNAMFASLYEPLDSAPTRLLGTPGPEIETITGELVHDETPALILAELQALRADLARARECHQPLSTRITSNRTKL
jgi:hypothetical protein